MPQYIEISIYLLTLGHTFFLYDCESAFKINIFRFTTFTIIKFYNIVTENSTVIEWVTHIRI